MITVACFGDSLIYGFPYGPQMSWLKRVESKAPHIKLLNYGECGATCSDILDNFQRTLLPENVSHVLFLGGANDILENRPVKYSIEDINKAYNLALAKNLAFGIILPWLSEDRAFNDKMILLREEIKNKFSSQCTIFDFQEAFTSMNSNSEERKFLDGIHPLGKTYEAIGDFAEPLLNVWLNKA